MRTTWTSIALAIALSMGTATAQQQPDSKLENDPVMKLQILLDRARISPGPIDGKLGKNTELAIRALQRKEGVEVTGEPSDEVLAQLEPYDDRPLFVEYEITAEDVKGPYIDEVPAEMEDMAKLDHISYTSVAEMLAERFHLDIDTLKQLNPSAEFDRAGTVIRVPDVERPEAVTAHRIEIDSENSVVRVFDENDAIIAVYPATIGSSTTPSPTGTHEVTRIAKEPNYTYDPKKLDFKGVEATEAFTIPPGPNNPVGLVWIALSEPGYGIHGSPEPEAIRRQASHGCVRLTNWDALDLLQMVSEGIEVAFVGGDSAATGNSNGSGQR